MDSPKCDNMSHCPSAGLQIIFGLPKNNHKGRKFTGRAACCDTVRKGCMTVEAMLQPISFYQFAISAPKNRTFFTSSRNVTLTSVGLVVLLHMAVLLAWMMWPASEPAPVNEMTVAVIITPEVQPEAAPAPPPPVVQQPRKITPTPEPMPVQAPVQAETKPVETPVAQPVAPVQPVAPAPVAAAPAPVAAPPVVAPPPPPAPVVPDVEPDYKASYLNNARPSYPYAARRMGLQGKVILNVEVLAEGTCGQINVLQSSGHEMLDNAALQAVKTWKFVPARSGGRAITKWFKVPIQFSLNSNNEA